MRGHRSVSSTLIPAAIAVCVWFLVAGPARAQGTVTVRRPVPGPVVPPPYFRAAVERQTRSPDGRPGPGYWQQHTTYDVEVSLEPEAGLVRGSERIRYENRSPHELSMLLVHLYQNLHAPGTVRSRPQEITGGVRLDRVAAGGVELAHGDVSEGPGYSYMGPETGRSEGPSQIMLIRPTTALPPGGSVSLEFNWSFTVPGSSSGRMGHSGEEVYFIAYWFPKMAVFDDLRGWDTDPYLGGAEFYDGFGDYRVSITVPRGWSVMATGELENPEEVFTEETRRRMAAALSADTIVRVATRADREAGRVTTGAGATLTYHFLAEGVRDFTWTASDTQLWDGTSAVVPDRDGDGQPDRVAIHSFYREDRAPLWREQALYGKHAIEHHSRFTGLAYPWPHMTSVEGEDIIGGGMEFPMLTVMGSYEGRQPVDLYSVTAHELAHMWIPMIVGTDERRHAWMDEGSTTFLENQGKPDYWPGTSPDSLEAESYLAVARAELEESMMTHGDHYEAREPAYGTASYAKPATLLVTLRELLGQKAFTEAYRGFISDWAFRHPTPWDFFNTFERVAGEDLDWFWTSWYYETWVLDQAVGEVREENGRVLITVRDQGFAPMPVLLRVEMRDGQVVERTVPADTWLRGDTEVEVVLPASMGEVVRVEIDPGRRFPDADRSNNLWIKG